jgi:tetratricopeptide (TPR) repeat protein
MMRRVELAELQRKVLLYIQLGRFDAAEKLLKATIHDLGPLANLLNLLGITLLRQSKFSDAITHFRQALQINPNFIEAALNLCVTLCDLGQYDEAQDIYTSVVAHQKGKRQRPDLIIGRIANMHVQCGQQYEANGLHSDAIQEYRKALSLYEKMPDVRLSLAKLYFRTGQKEKAQMELEEAVKSQPPLAEAHVWLGLAYFKLGRIDQSRVHWEKAKQISPSELPAHALLKLVNAPAR